MDDPISKLPETNSAMRWVSRCSIRQLIKQYKLCIIVVGMATMVAMKGYPRQNNQSGQQSRTDTKIDDQQASPSCYLEARNAEQGWLELHIDESNR